MRKLKIGSALMLCCSLMMSTAQANGVDIPSGDLIDEILSRFANTAATWSEILKEYASWLFWSLTLISMVWTYGFMFLKKADLGDFLAETIGFFTTTGFFFWLLRNGPDISMAIINSLRQMASKASGLSNSVSPSGVIGIGFDIVGKVIDNSSMWSPARSTVGLIVAGIILVCLTLVAVNMLLILIYAWVLSYGGVFLLGFGGGRWTQDIAINYFKSVLGTGMETFTMVLIVGIGRSFVDQFYAVISNDITLKALFVMLAASIILFVLVREVPPKFASLVSGQSYSGSGGFGMGAALSAAGMASAMASSAGSSITKAAANAGGGASAIKAAVQAAQSTMQSNMPDGKKTNGSSSFAAAMGNVGNLMAGTGSQLAQGMAQTASDKMTSFKEKAQERIANTLGGQVAEAIHTNSSSFTATQKENSSNNKEEGSLGAGSRKNDEVVDFAKQSSSSMEER